MHRTRACAMAIAALVFCTGTVAAQDYFQQFVHYTIDVSLDTDNKRVSGRETIRYVNNSPDELTVLYLHLYPNAYKSKDTAFMRDYRRRFNLTLLDVPKRHRSDLNISDVTIDGQAVTPKVDDTIARIELPAPLAAGATMEIELAFDGNVRKHLGRAGYGGEHYDFAQWYPKVVVYDENGHNPDQFMTGEFYGEFGTFDVNVDLPAHYVVAATGTLEEGDAGWTYNSSGARQANDGSRKTVRFHAENVHDFAWCADPTFVVQDTTWNGVEIKSFYRQRNASSWQDTTLAHAVRAMKWLDDKVGPYPYPQVSVVDALLRGGMEYPMLVMDGRASEGLVLHEIGHIYFFGILGNDEREEAWLDEGFTTFQTQWNKESRYGPWGNKAEWNWYQRITPQPKLWEGYRSKVSWYDRRSYSERVSTRAEKFDNSYYLNVYTKPALILNAIRHIVGDDEMREILREYHKRWQFKHVNEARFREVVEEATGANLERGFDQWLHTRKTVDYRLAEVKTTESETGVKTRVRVERQGELTIPITLEFTMKDGSVEKRRIDGRLRTTIETFDLPSKPKRTAVNEENEIMDVDHADNFLPRRRAYRFDWPNNHYYPEYGYTVRYRPGVWYNTEDGAKAGLHFRGSYYNWSRRLKLGVYYGFLSERVDFSAAYDKPYRFTDRNGELHISGYKMEGRQDVTLALRLNHRSNLLDPPTHNFVIGWNYHELTNPRYLTSSEIYDTNQADVGVNFGYSVDPQLDVMSTRLETTVKLGRKWTGGKFKYERFSAEITTHSRTELQPVDLRLRGFVGMAGGNSPLQQKFSIAGAGPLQLNERFWLRSEGAIWPDANYHEPGDGNLRGYLPGTFGVNRLMSFNAELGTRLPLGPIDRALKTFPGKISWYAFYDVGKIFDDANPIGSSARVQALFDSGLFDSALQNAGVGFRSRAPLPFWDLRLRVDLPLWVSDPQVIGEKDETRFRYLFSISSTF